jgi:hypothetical protein
LLGDSIKEYITVLSQERDILSIIESISEVRITRHGLSISLMVKMKAPVKTWRWAAS